MARKREPTEEPDYIIDEEERAHIEGMALFCVLCIFCILVADVVIFIRGSSIPHLGDLFGLYTVLFFLISVYDWSHLRHIKATIEWSPVSLTLQDGKKKRYIVFQEGFCVTGMILCFRRRYRAVEKPFLVFWKPGQRPPKPHSWPIRLLRRSKCLFLPDTPEARAKVTKILGLEVPEFPKVCCVPPKNERPEDF